MARHSYDDFYSLTYCLHLLCWIEEKDNDATDVATVGYFFHCKIRPIILDVVSCPTLMLMVLSWEMRRKLW